MTGDCAVCLTRGEWKASEKQKWWRVTVGAVFDYVAVRSKVVMLLSHLDSISSGGRHLFVCLPRTLTAWQPRSHQGAGAKRKGREEWVFVASAEMRLWFVSPPPPRVLVCADAYFSVCSLAICL